MKKKYVWLIFILFITCVIVFGCLFIYFKSFSLVSKIKGVNISISNKDQALQYFRKWGLLNLQGTTIQTGLEKNKGFVREINVVFTQDKVYGNEIYDDIGSNIISSSKTTFNYGVISLLVWVDKEYLMTKNEQERDILLSMLVFQPLWKVFHPIPPYNSQDFQKEIKAIYDDMKKHPFVYLNIN